MISVGTTQITEAFQQAFDFVQYTDRAIFLTGKAGTGKTTFLRYVKENALKDMSVVAPTGVAAINAGGVTIHSFFQLPLNHYIPEERAGLENFGIIHKKRLLAEQRMVIDRRKVLQALELLVIDEVSMVRADLLDMIDVVLRYVRFRPEEPFGGVQVLLIGDLYQLPPVVDDQAWSILGEYYTTPFFFSAKVMQQAMPVHISFEKVFRQQDETFINILNAVRNNDLVPELAGQLHQRYQPNFQPEENEGYITLTTHNNKANAINEMFLQKLATPLQYFPATINGDFSNKAYPAEENLALKVGAQVMFLKNDMNQHKRFFNGKIGKVVDLEYDVIKVLCPGESSPIPVTRYTWENIRYVPNLLNGQVDEEEIGSFVQFPLRLAWAITIHKSQGLTFEKAIIDAEDAFASGQAYVALSRCRTLEGMVLKTPVRVEKLTTNQSVDQYTQTRPSGDVLPSQLETSLKEYTKKRLKRTFSLGATHFTLNRLKKIFAENPAIQIEANQNWLKSLAEKIQALTEVIKKFHAYIDQHAGTEALNQKVRLAVPYYINELGSLLKILKSCPVESDNKATATDLKALLKEFFETWEVQLKHIELAKEGFEIQKFLKDRKQIMLEKWEPIVFAGAKSAVANSKVPNAPLYFQLVTWRDQEAIDKDLPIYRVLPTNTLKAIALALPLTPQELQQIQGIGATKVKQYGRLLLDMISTYASEHGLESNLESLTNMRRELKEAKPRTDKPDTKLLSFDLFKAGKSVDEIAKERNFVTSTIEGHLAHFVEKGVLDEGQFVPSGLIEPIRQRLQTEMSWNDIIAELGNAVTYSHLRFMGAAKKRDAVPADEKDNPF